MPGTANWERFCLHLYLQEAHTNIRLLGLLYGESRPNRDPLSLVTLLSCQNVLESLKTHLILVEYGHYDARSLYLSTLASDCASRLEFCLQRMPDAIFQGDEPSDSANMKKTEDVLQPRAFRKIFVRQYFVIVVYNVM